MANKFSIRDLRLVIKYHLKKNPAGGPIHAEKVLGVHDLGFNLSKYYKELLKYKSDFKIARLDNIVYKSKQYPIYKIETKHKASKKLLVLCGVHGNEQAGILIVMRLLDDIKKYPRYYKHISITIVTPVNPVGAAHFSRYNGDGEDINRDFYLFKTKEARLARDVFSRLSPDFVVTCHEGPQDGTFLYVNKYVNKSDALSIVNSLKKGKVKLAKESYFKTKFKKPGYFPLQGILFTLKLWKWLLKMVAFGLYATEGEVPQITIEGEWRSKDREQRIKSQLITIRSIVKLI